MAEQHRDPLELWVGTWTPEEWLEREARRAEERRQAERRAGEPAPRPDA
ncbi:MAG TPA: hypothetical protein VNN19_12425 [bacterium]|nr:hypothetical protein [bacterium]